MQSIHGVLIDVSGTVHVGDKVVPGAVQALDRLRASGIPFRFCTNTTQYSGDTLANKLRKFGFNVKREEMNKAFKILLATKSSSTAGTGTDTGVDAATAAGIPRFIAVHKAKYFADKDQTDLSMGPGGFVQALEFATGVQAHVVGKPQKAFFELAIQNMNLSLPTSTPPTTATAKTPVLGTGIVMIGDDIEQDLGGGAAELGFVRYLVQTGKYRTRDEDRDMFGGIDGVFSDFASVVDHILQQQQQQ
ncbi:hypothetical protein BGX24_008804 [Mortierella sp. AD032]|nr:hypothetical protein BGX24_008804 [Mortierella sp. AD032]